jgi:hypothetical protein
MPARFKRDPVPPPLLVSMMHHRRACMAGFIAVVAGIVITWISGFFTPLFPERTVDVLQWGSPFAYLHRVVTFHTAPFVDWTMAFVDFVIWTVIVFVIVYLAWPEASGKEKGD